MCVCVGTNGAVRASCRGRRRDVSYGPKLEVLSLSGSIHFLGIAKNRTFRESATNHPICRGTVNAFFGPDGPFE